MKVRAIRVIEHKPPNVLQAQQFEVHLAVVGEGGRLTFNEVTIVFPGDAKVTRTPGGGLDTIEGLSFGVDYELVFQKVAEPAAGETAVVADPD